LTDDLPGIENAIKMVYPGFRMAGKEGILRLRERWVKIYPKVEKKWEDKAYALLTFLRYPKEIRQFIYTTNEA
jgi:putative transposase